MNDNLVHDFITEKASDDKMSAYMKTPRWAGKTLQINQWGSKLTQGDIDAEEQGTVLNTTGNLSISPEPSKMKPKHSPEITIEQPLPF